MIVGYRWWTVFAWRDHAHAMSGMKIGPLTVFAYRWFDGRWRGSWTWLGGREHIVFGAEHEVDTA